MSEINNLLNSSIAKTEQLKNRARAEKRRKQEVVRKANLRRYIAIGKLVCKYFPTTMEYQPQSRSEESEVVFRSMEERLQWLADHMEMIESMSGKMESKG